MIRVTGICKGGPRALSFGELAEHFFGVDGDEGPAAAGQHFSVFVENLGHVDVPAAVHADLAAFHAQGFVERDGLDVLDGHLFGEGNDVAQLVDLAHGVVEDGGDDAAVAVSGRAGVAFAEAEFADEAVPFLGELQAHALGIVGATGEAKVFLLGI